MNRISICVRPRALGPGPSEDASPHQTSTDCASHQAGIIPKSAQKGISLYGQNSPWFCVRKIILCRLSLSSSQRSYLLVFGHIIFLWTNTNSFRCLKYLAWNTPIIFSVLWCSCWEVWGDLVSWGTAGLHLTSICSWRAMTGGVKDTTLIVLSSSLSLRLHLPFPKCI